MGRGLTKVVTSRRSFSSVCMYLLRNLWIDLNRIEGLLVTDSDLKPEKDSQASKPEAQHMVGILGFS